MSPKGLPQHDGDTMDHLQASVVTEGVPQNDGDIMDHFLVFSVTARPSTTRW